MFELRKIYICINLLIGMQNARINKELQELEKA
jgi:hypothetical protein